MLPFGGVNFLPQKTFADACQPLGADEFQPVLKRVSVGRLAIDELSIGDIRREQKLRLLGKRRALAVATGTARAKDAITNNALSGCAAIVAHSIKTAHSPPTPVLKHCLLVGGLE